MTLRPCSALLTALALAACSSTPEPAPKAATPAAASAPAAAVVIDRPQLSDAAAANATALKYFAAAGKVEAPTVDNWNPMANGVGDVKTFKPAMVVAADGSGTHTTVQAAIDAAVAAGGSNRIFILVKPGTYRGQVCIRNAPPITLYGADTDASKVVIVDNKSNGTAKPKEQKLNDCEGRAGADTYGTSGSSSVHVNSNDFHAKNLTFANDFDESTATRNLQAVAVTSTGDRVIFDNVRFLANIDTVQPKSPSTGTISRVYFVNCYIEGDGDYVFGRAVTVFDRVEFKSLSSRTKESFVFAPSHPQLFQHGFLVINSRFTGDGGVVAGQFLGRAWDDSGGAYSTPDGKEHLPNGMVVVRDSVIGAHIAAQPWDRAATTGRPFDSKNNVKAKLRDVEKDFPPARLFEYKNSGPGAAK